MRESENHIETTEQKITLERLEREGLILDIGGGGEGLVSRIEGNRVCALDIRLSEIREAQIHGHSSNWFVADGRHPCFSDESFDIVTLWFSLGYMSEWNTKRAVLDAAYQVLRKEGRLSILATHIPETSTSVIFWGVFTLPDGTLSRTGYGMKGGQNQTISRIQNLVIETGFNQIKHENHGEWFKITAIKS